MGSACMSSKDRMVHVSKEMSYMLRHRPPPGMTSDGYISLPALLTHMKHKPTEQEIRATVSCDVKNRYSIDDTTQPPRIRANQGHSFSVQNLELEPITDAAQVPFAVHVTGKQGWEAIQESGELHRMNRTHIHFASEQRHMRTNTWAILMLKLDLAKALSDGYQFWRSSNGVVLAEGPIPLKLLSPVTAEQLL